MAQLAGRLFLALLAVLLGLAGWTVYSLLAPSSSSPPSSSEASPRFLFWELQEDTTTFYSASADDPSQRQPIAVVSHRPGYGPRATISPDGRSVAFTLLPSSAPDREGAAALWLLDLVTGRAQALLATGVDLRQAPQWSPDARFLAFRRTVPLNSQESSRFELLALDRQSPSSPSVLAVATSEEVLALVPIGWTDQDRFYYARISPQGTEIWERSSGGTTRRASLGTEVARDFQLSPQRQKLAFATPSRLGILDLSSGQLQALTAQTGTPLSPTWTPDGQQLSYGLATSAAAVGVQVSGLAEASLTALQAPPYQGFDSPVAWSPAASHLALRSLQGPSPQHLQAEHLVILSSASAQRRPVVSTGAIQFVGWLP